MNVGYRIVENGDSLDLSSNVPVGHSILEVLENKFEKWGDTIVPNPKIYAVKCSCVKNHHPIVNGEVVWNEEIVLSWIPNII